jgi:hypothetical protein
MNINDDVIYADMASVDISRLRKDVEPFQSELMEEFYSNYAGLKDEMSTVGIYERYGHLFSEDAIAEVARTIEDTGEGEDSRWLKYLRTFATMGYVDNAVKVLTDKAQTFESQAEVEVSGERIPYRFVPVKLRNEPDARKRKELFDAKLRVTDEFNKILLERMATAHDLSAVLDFKNYRDMCSSLKGIDYLALEGQMDELVKRTDSLYTRSIPFAFRGEEFDPLFAKDNLVDKFFSTLKGMGLDPESYDNIHVDLEDRPKKTPRAFCAPVKVPGDVRLVIRPTGGWRDYDAFFHEGGHAWHFGSTKANLPPEYRYLGDNSVTEAFAFLFNYLPSNPLWLKEVLGMKDPTEYVRFTLVNKLMFLRRYSSKLTYELKLHSSKVSGEFEGVYRTCLQKALKFRHTEKHYLEDVDDAFYCAEYLRAWILEGQIRAALEEQFGEDWFMKEKAGSFLKELWSYGQKFTADELVKTIGYVDLDPDHIVLEIERGLSD